MPIIFDCCGKIEEAQKNLYPKVGKDICPAVAEKVWNAISNFIATQLCQGHGVRIPGFVTFNYKILTRQLNQKKVVVERIPFMLLSEEIAKMYGLTVKRPMFNFEISTVPLNLSQIAADTCLPRSSVETCVEEIIQAFKRAIVMDDHVEFHFTNIGRLVIKDTEVEPFFCTRFMDTYNFGQEILKDRTCPKLP